MCGRSRNPVIITFHSYSPLKLAARWCPLTSTSVGVPPSVSRCDSQVNSRLIALSPDGCSLDAENAHPQAGGDLGDARHPDDSIPVERVPALVRHQTAGVSTGTRKYFTCCELKVYLNKKLFF